VCPRTPIIDVNLSDAIRIRHRPLVALATALMVATAVQFAPASASAQSGTEVICEATGNPASPYVEIRVTQADLGNYSTGEGDIIPAPADGCPTALNATPPPGTTSGSSTTTATTVTSSATTSFATSSSRTHTHTRTHTRTSTGSAGVSATSTTSSTTTSVAETTTAAPATTSASAGSASPPISTLPRTGGDTRLTLVLGLLLLYFGAVIRWATARRKTWPEVAAARAKRRWRR
jgi:hypothetical protein